MIDFGIQVKVINQGKKDDKSMWKLELGYNPTADISSFGCKESDSKCSEILKFLKIDLPHLVITHLEPEEHAYDQPISARSLLGLMGYINDFTERPIETTHMQMTADHSLQMFFNCKKDSIESVLSKPIGRDTTEFSFMQNLLDNFGFPHEITITTDEIYEKALEKGLMDPVEDSKKELAMGATIRFTKDPLTLSKLKYGSGL